MGALGKGRMHGGGRLTIRITAAALLLVALVGCASASITGQLSVPGREINPATIRYQSSLFGGGGKLWANLPTGENFTGTYVLQPREPDAHMVGTLAGDRGSTMVCRFRLNEPGVGPDGGGSVHCNVSSGAMFNATF
jgi:hypothetical protein